MSRLVTYGNLHAGGGGFEGRVFRLRIKRMSAIPKRSRLQSLYSCPCSCTIGYVLFLQDFFINWIIDHRLVRQCRLLLSLQATEITDFTWQQSDTRVHFVPCAACGTRGGHILLRLSKKNWPPPVRLLNRPVFCCLGLLSFGGAKRGPNWGFSDKQ